MRTHAWVGCLAMVGILGILAVAGCDATSGAPGPGVDGADPDGTSDAVGAPDGANGVDGGPDTATAPPVTELGVAADACCLSLSGGALVWAEGGDVYGYFPQTGVREALVVHPAQQKDPVLSGSLLVWADDRGGDYDLWARDLAGGAAYRLIGGPGDQDQPSLDGTQLAWIGRDAAPHDAAAAEVWVMDVSALGSARALTADGFEQTQPHLAGGRVVWADFRASDAGVYLPVADPTDNNADIYGWDLAAEAELVVTTDLSKQLRPAIDGDRVVWLDWRGINPEPKYSEFQVFTKRLGEPEERRVAWSSWARPDLWQRPAVSGDVIAWVAEPGALGGFATGMYAVRADGGEPWLVAGSPGVLEAIALGGGQAAWLGGGKLGLRALAAP